MPIDKGVRKFRAMVLGLCFLFAGFLLAGWRGWVELFSEYAWGVFGLVGMFTVPNVAEKIITRFPKRKPVTPKV